MNYFLRALCPSVAVSVLAFSSVASAQSSGSNVVTPTQPSTTTTMATTPSSAPAHNNVDMNEPVIDATSTQTTFINRPLLVTGLVFLAGSYGTAAVIAATSDRDADQKLYYPVAGPWLDLANRDCNVNICPNEDWNRAGLIADGIVQGIGALGVLGSLVIPEKTTHRWYLIGGDSFRVAPSHVGRYGYGLAAVGTF